VIVVSDEVDDADGRDDAENTRNNAFSGINPQWWSQAQASAINPQWWSQAQASAISNAMANVAMPSPLINAEFQRALESISKSIASLTAPTLFNSTEILRAFAARLGSYPALSKANNYKNLDAPAGPYSPHMQSPQSYFASTEEVIESFDGLHRAISTLMAHTPGLPLVWRGAKNADWGLQSHLYRHLMEVNGVVPPSKRPTKDQPYPTEDQVVAAEREILRLSRRDWRFDNLSALETFARIQHAGGPTRLIDVTKNPYIGAWFAVEFDKKEEDKDARLFAMATKPVAKDGKPQAPDATLELDEFGASRDPFWHFLANSEARQKLDWGTGARRLLWVPPAYDPRISAQNAAFVLDGVPMTSPKTAPYFTKGRGVYWRRADLLAAGSIYARMVSPRARPKYNAPNFAPTFSFRIKAEAKQEIRDVMESRFGYRLSYVYPDMAGLASHLNTLSLGGA